MKTPFLPFCLLSICLLSTNATFATDPAASRDWPGWRGPDRTGVTNETGLLKSWPDEGPELLWSIKDAGVGYSGLAILGDRFYTAGAEGETEFVMGYDLATGKRLWSTEIGKLDHQDDFWGRGPKGTPATDGEYVVLLGGQGNLICVRADTGEKVWLKNYVTDLKAELANAIHGRYCESPILDGDQVVCIPGGKEGCVLALDKKTGNEIWRSKELQDVPCLSSAIIAELGGVRQYVLQTRDSVAGIDCKDGKLLWRFERPGGGIPTPIITGDLVFVASEFQEHGCHLLRVTRDGDKFKCEEVYHGDDKHTVFHNVDGGCCVLLDGYLYGFNRPHVMEGRRTSWLCMELETGKIMWGDGEDGENMDRGCLTAADGQLYCYDSVGTVALVDATPKGWVERGRFDIPSKPLARGSATYPVILNGKLYLRNQKFIYCYDIKDPAAK